MTDGERGSSGVPEGWQAGKIGDVVKQLTSGVSVNGEDRQKEDGEIGVLKVSAVSYGRFKPNEHKTVVADDITRVATTPIKNSILVSRANTPELVGASAYITDDFRDLFLPDKLWQIAPDEDVFSTRWLSYCFSSDVCREAIKNNATGSSNSMKNISQSAFLNIDLLVPPLEEQRKIAEILSTWDEAIEQQTRLLELKRERKRGLMQQLLTGRVRFREFAGLEWETVTLEDIAEVFMGSSPSSTAYNEEKLGLPLLQGNADIKNRRSKPKVWTTEVTRECKVGDILVSVRAPVGSISLSMHHACIGRGIAAARAKPFVALQDYLYQYLVHLEPAWARLSQGSTFEAVNSKDLKSLPLKMPKNMDEQQKIATVLSAADAEIETLTIQLSALKAQKRGMMQRLLTGKTRVQLA